MSLFNYVYIKKGFNLFFLKLNHFFIIFFVLSLKNQVFFFFYQINQKNLI